MSIANTTSPGANPTGLTYVDGLIWGTSWDLGTNIGGPAGTLTYSFDDGTLGDQPFAKYMKAAIRAAFDLIETIIPIEFTETNFLAPNGAINQVNLTYGLVTQDTLGGSIGFHQVPGDTPLLSGSLGLDALFGLFAYDTVLWSKAALRKGGEGFATVLHEILHGMGLAHPHDDGGSSSVFPGVAQPFDDFGTDGQNQGVYTIMSYNSGYPEMFPLHYYDIGGTASPMALDIAALQAIYGTQQHNTENDVYKIKGSNKVGTAWTSIWDTGGIDTLSAAGVGRSVTINLNDADLEGDDAGGAISSAEGVRGGFTIANSVVIENAIGGNGGDAILGNEVGNVLQGRSGSDTIYGAEGEDTLSGGGGHDTLSGDTGADTVLGGGGKDNILAQDADGNDVLDGGGGSDWIRFLGTGAATVDLSNIEAQDTGYGVDTLQRIENVSGTAQADQITGSKKANILQGNDGNDTLNGLEGRDTLEGGQGNDTLTGGTGSDKLLGGTGQDILAGGTGKDFLTGGDDADTFVFNTIKDSSKSAGSADVITDFEVGVDKIDLSGIDASTVLDGDDAFTFNGTTPFSTADQGEIYYKQIDSRGTASDRTLVFIDTDGDKSPEMVIRLNGLLDLTADDFIL